MMLWPWRAPSLVVVLPRTTNVIVFFSQAKSPPGVISTGADGSLMAAGTLAVEFSTTNGTAISGVNYLGLTNTLTWNNGEIAPKIVAIPLLQDGLVETNDMTVNLRLRSATLNGTNDSAALIGTINATLSITNSDFRGQVAFSSPGYTVNENGGPGYITVVRKGGSAESITVSFATDAELAAHFFADMLCRPLVSAVQLQRKRCAGTVRSVVSTASRSNGRSATFCITRPKLEHVWLADGSGEACRIKLEAKLRAVRNATITLSTVIHSQFFCAKVKAACIPRKAIHGTKPVETNRASSTRIS